MVKGEDGKAYTVTRLSDAVYDPTPATLDSQSYLSAVRTAADTLGLNRSNSTYTYSPVRTLYTSPGGTTNRVHAETSELSGAPLSEAALNDYQERLAAEGLSLDAVDAVAVGTADMTTFMQMVETMGPRQLMRVLAARAEHEEQRLHIPDVVPDGFLNFTNSASELSNEQRDVVRQAPALRKLYAKLHEAGYDGADVQWVFVVNGKKGPDLKFAHVNGYRKSASGEIVAEPMLVRGDAVAGIIQLGGDITAVSQARIPTGSNHLQEVLAGMLDPSDPMNSVKEALKTRIKAEANEETGMPEDIVDAAQYVCEVTGLYPSAYSTEEILLGVLKAEPLPEALREELLDATRGEEDEHEAVHLQLLQNAEALAASTQDLKTRLLAILLHRTNLLQDK